MDQVIRFGVIDEEYADQRNSYYSGSQNLVEYLGNNGNIWDDSSIARNQGEGFGEGDIV